MPQQSPSPTNSPSDPGFVPRKEFIREQKTTPSSFAIVVISASSLVRLYSFPSSVIVALRALFEASSSLVLLREDVQQHFCEFVLTGKPWASPKSVRAEKLLIDILAIIYQCGYTYLSSLDYGRESDDRLAMAFSKPLSSPVSNSRSTTPLPESISPFQQSSISTTLDQPKSRRSPFALSFLSPTRMRVIAPPLHLTPAILQAVRASWPRGVVSERKVGTNSFEFKLKGYKWFQQDTFATDSLRYILALLTSLDSQAFTLLSSISMTNRSRVKDLWVFTGPGSDDIIPHESTLSPPARDRLNETMNRAHSPGSARQSGSSSGISHHRRLLSEPTGSTTYVYPDMQGTPEKANAQKNFSFIHGYRAEYSPTGPALLRKPAPRAQVPVSIVHEADPPGTDGLRAYLPSMISSDVEDMTGVGTNGFEAPQSVFPSNQSERSAARILATSSSSRRLSTPTSTRPRSPLRSVVNRQKTPPLLTVNPIHSSSSPAHIMPHVGLQGLGTELLASEIFTSGVRDSFAPQNEGTSAAKNEGTMMTTSRRKLNSTGAVSSGSSRPRPIEEQDPGDVIGLGVHHHEDSMSYKKTTGNETPPIHEVSSRVASPELTRPDIPLRKSEAALVGLIKDTSPAPALPATPKAVIGTDSHNTGKGQGWVLVNVGESLTGSQVGLDESLDSTKRSEGSEHMTPSPHAKAIAVIDALDNKSNGKGKSAAFAQVKKRFFYLGRKNPEKEEVADALSGVDEAGLSKPRSGFRDRFRIPSTSQGIRGEKEH